MLRLLAWGFGLYTLLGHGILYRDVLDAYARFGADAIRTASDLRTLWSVRSGAATVTTSCS